MNTASAKLSNELFELSGWKSELITDKRLLDKSKYSIVPSYDLGYLLRKLPLKHGNETLSLVHDDDPNRQPWECGFSDLFVNADTPEDAACKLAIELFKQGVLT